MASLLLKVDCVILLLACATWLSEAQSCKQCPQYWMQVGEHCYRYFGPRKNWHDAHTVCSQFAAHLPSIHNHAEETTLYQLWKGLVRDHTRLEDAYWLGLRDTSREGRFEWSDGTRRVYTNWHPGQPDNFFGEDCVEVRNHGRNDDERMRWNDRPCENTRSFFCRKRL